MSNYSPIVDYAAKDVLLTGDPSKRILGTEISAELTSISSMSASKEDVVEKDAANGYAGLGADAKLPDATLSANVPLLDGTNEFSGENTFTTNVSLESTTPILRLEQTDAAADEKIWRFWVVNGNMFLSTRTDAGAVGASAMSITRTGTVVDLLTSHATQTAVMFGTAAAPSLCFDGDVNTGLYRYAANELAIALDGVDRARFAGTALFVDKIEFGSVTQTDTTVTRDSAGHLAVEGNTIWDEGNITLDSGTYTPTVSATTNIDATTPRAAQYLRIGDTVFVSGQIDVTPTDTITPTSFNITLPIASNFAQVWQCSGVAADPRQFAVGVGNWVITADTTNDRATFTNQGVSGDTSRTVSYQFGYRVF
jgi:enamine deaminase RidA (YjgF/YER057c/UK114 family)